MTCIYRILFIKENKPEISLMNTIELIEHVKNISIWKKGGQRAPHKPLLLLFALGKCFRNEGRLISYTNVETALKPLLMEFGPTRKSYHPEHPFWRLKRDGIWELSNFDNINPNPKNGNVRVSDLRKFDVHGGFNEEIYTYLSQNNDGLIKIVSYLLESNFPVSIHEDILRAVGIDLVLDRSVKRKRDPQFRDKMLIAYENQCAVCGFNVRVGNSLIGLEAAHIKWHQAGGPDIEKNGLILCSLHHKLFDRGAFSITQDMKVSVSDRANGTIGFNEWLLAFHDKEIRKPQRISYFPDEQFVDWHCREVFQGYGREVT